MIACTIQHIENMHNYFQVDFYQFSTTTSLSINTSPRTHCDITYAITAGSFMFSTSVDDWIDYPNHV